MSQQHEKNHKHEPSVNDTWKGQSAQWEPENQLTKQAEGPTDIDGAEASELPDKGRGPVEQNMTKEALRRLPSKTGGIPGNGTDVGIRGEPDIAESDEHGGRKKN